MRFVKLKFATENLVYIVDSRLLIVVITLSPGVHSNSKLFKSPHNPTTVRC